MKIFVFSIALLLAFLAGSSFCFGQKSPIDAANAKQMILVTTSDWNAVPAKLEIYERVNGDWRKIGKDVAAVVGRSGLAWGDGLHETTKISLTEPRKREGDGRSPAGVFKLTFVFGTAAKPGFLQTPFAPLLPSTECVDDVKSAHYNQIVDRAKIEKVDWDSSEKMLAVGEQYAWGIFVAHNSAPVKSGNGSCIFLHIWKDAATGTAGCTAMPRADLETILRWLDARRNPVLVQLPASARERLQKTWKLPPLNN